MLNQLKPKISPILDIITKPFIKVHPNILSALSLLFSAASCVAFAYKETLFASFLFLGTGLDAFDGHVARATGKDSKFGGLLDSVIDRITEALFLFGAALGGFVSFPVAFVTIVASLLVSYVKAQATAAAGITTIGTNPLSVGIAERTDRLALMFLGAILLSFDLTILNFNTFEIASFLILFGTLVTVIWRMSVAYKLLKNSA